MLETVVTSAAPPVAAQICAIAIACIAAHTDTRDGRIPNWLTLPPLLLAPLAYGVLAGSSAALMSVMGALVCGFVPALLFRKGALGGGDVKLLAALGALLGLGLGLEAQLLGFIVGGVYALARALYTGHLKRVLGNVAQVATGPFRGTPGSDARAPRVMTSVRLGGAILVATLVVLVP